MEQLQGHTISFQLYAHNEQEVEECRQAIVDFINQHRKEGRAVTAEKVTHAIANWGGNPFVKSQIINYFK